MRHAPIDSSLFVHNRERLRALLPPNSLVIVNANDIHPTNADGEMPYHPNSDLFHLAGVEQEQSILILSPDAHDPKMKEQLFLRETSEQIAIWEGHKLTKDEAKKASGIERIHWLTDLPVMLRRHMCEAENVFLNTNEHGRSGDETETRDLRFIRALQHQYPVHRYHRLARLMHQLRVVKSEAEVALIKKACGITRDGFARVAKFLKPGVNECEIEAEFIHEFIRQRGKFAYNPIIASGANNNVLHYNANDQPCKKGDLLLLDVAASYGNYNSDLTRTIPVSGKFTRRQREVYDAVLRVFRAGVKGLVPGKLPRIWQEESEALMTEECLKLGLLKPKDVKKQDPDKPAVKKYFMHGLGHPIGLDVHDVVSAGMPFAAGWVMTVEPGLYIPDEGFGVRLENDVLITADGQVDLMEDIPIEAGDVEALMRG